MPDAPSVREPVGQIDARKQCNGDWEFWAECGIEFIRDAEARVLAPLEGEMFEKIAHTVKTGETPDILLHPSFFS